MRDDAIYCEHPNGAEIAYIPYYIHRILAWKERKKTRRLALALAVMSITTAALIAALIFR